MLHARPDLLHRILEVNARAVTAYLNAQIDAGAQVVMLFDTWGGILAHDDYEDFLARLYAQGDLQQGDAACRRSSSPRAAAPWLGAMMQSGCDAVGLDWTSDPRDARARSRPDASRCKEIWIRRRCSRRRIACARPRAACSTLSAPRPDTFSISATESASTRRWNRLPRS